MQINFNHTPNIAKASPASGFSNIHFGSEPVKSDVFVKSAENSEKASRMEKSIEYAKKACAKAMHNDKTAVEHIVLIDKDGSVYYEDDGSEGSCSFKDVPLREGSIVVHGHPGEGLEPLSCGDLAAFFARSEIKTMIAVNKDERACYMTKPDDFKSSDAADDLFEMQMETFIKAEGKTPNNEVTGEYIEELEEKLKNAVGIEDTNELYPAVFGCKKPDSPKMCLDLLSFQLYMHNIQVPSPMHQLFLNSYNSIKEDDARFIEVCKEYNKAVAKKYNLKWSYEEA